jgi:hypothetical protein
MSARYGPERRSPGCRDSTQGEKKYYQFRNTY